jgi:hypothetical protein
MLMWLPVAGLTRRLGSSQRRLVGHDHHAGFVLPDGGLHIVCYCEVAASLSPCRVAVGFEAAHRQRQAEVADLAEQAVERRLVGWPAC